MGLLERLDLAFFKRSSKKRPRFDGIALRNSGNAWTDANSVFPGTLLERVKPMTDEEATAAMDAAKQDAEEYVRWEIAEEEAEAEEVAQKAAAQATPEQAAVILAAAADEKSRRMEEAPARKEAAIAGAIERAERIRAARIKEWENAAAAAKIVKANSDSLETDLLIQLRRSADLKKKKDIGASLKDIFNTIEMYKYTIEQLRVRAGLSREAYMIDAGAGEDGGDGPEAGDQEPLDADLATKSPEDFIAILTDKLSAAIQGIAKTAAEEAKKIDLDLQKDFDRLYSIDTVSSVHFTSQPVDAEEPEFLSNDPYAGQRGALRSMTSSFARSFERLTTLTASIAEIAAQPVVNVGETAAPTGADVFTPRRGPI
jgi:hypothetical protein